MNIQEVKQQADKICDNMEQVIVGKRDVMEAVLAAFLADGHVLVEDVPGTGKTMLAKSLAASFGLSFQRIQFTPDLLPSDVTGIHYYNQKSNEFEFRPGAIFGNILLADEINRATPRTQSSLLECMEERQATIDGVTMEVGQPFFVIATQNPVETSGTFPLPEAQLDRFMVKLSMGYPEEKEERDLLARFAKGESGLDKLQAVCSGENFTQMQEACRQVRVQEVILQYVMDIVKQSREERGISIGISTRGGIALVRFAQCYAAVKGQDFVTADMIKQLAPMVFAHRIIPEDPFATKKTLEEYIHKILREVKAPTEEGLGR